MYNLLHLKYALEVEKTGSFSKAAQNLYMNQPQVSKAIKELETSLNIIIFDRTPAGAVVTAKGKEFFKHARNVINEVEQMEKLSTKAIKSNKVLNISVPRASYVSYAFTEFLNSIKKDHALNADYRETHSARAMKSVSKSENNLGIIRYRKRFEEYFLTALDKYDLVYEDIFSFEYLLLMSKDSPMAKKEKIYMEDIQDKIEIIHGDISIPARASSRQDILKLGKEKKISVYERASQLEMLDRIPETFMWASPMPQYILDKFNLIQRKCEGGVNVYKDIFIYKKDHILSDLEIHFMEIVKKTAEKLNRL